MLAQKVYLKVENCFGPSGVLSLSALSISSVYLGHDDELHWFNESRAHSCLSETCMTERVCVCGVFGTACFDVKILTIKFQVR